jgi:DNA-binding MarR family transcriptional regulator
MERWGYVFVKPDPNDNRAKPPLRDWIVSPKVRGRMAQQVWPKLFEVIESRWRSRFGDANIDKLRESLRMLIAQFDIELPEYLPVLGYGLIATFQPIKRERPDVSEENTPGSLRLPTLLSRVLLAFTIDFERESELSLAICANIVRVLSDQGTPVRDLPRLSGVSKEAIKMALGFLEKRGYIVVESQPASGQSKPNRVKAAGTKMVRLTTKGVEARDDYRLRLDRIEKQWCSRFGEEAIGNLRQSLEPMVGDGMAQASPLFQGLEPYPEGWRASVPKPETLPHYPMVLHRGGYPDGS